MVGYYLVKDDPSVLEGEENKDVSDYILQVVGNVTVEHKGSIPTMDKQVSETGDSYNDSILSGINTTHHYRIVAELPDDYDLYDNYYLEFSDKMSKELTFEEVYSVYVVIRSTGDRIEVDPSCYTVSTAAIADSELTMPGGTHLRVVLNDTKTIIAKETGLPITLTSEDAVVIKYTGHINSNAVVSPNGIPNEATIIYSNDPNSDGHGETNPDETNVYPINLELIKIDGKDSTALDGAKFVLTRLHNDGSATHTEYAKLDDNNKMDAWVHHAEGDGCAADNADHLAAVAAGEVGTVLTTVAGEIRVYGLDAGTYTLVEIEAPDGYNKLVEGVHFTVNATIDEAADVIASMTGTTNQGNIHFDPTTATVELTIPNFKGDVLPSTGGIGTTLFYILGGMMVVCAAVLLVTKKRMAV
jgi:fimbrial isopeptide formation D2 family protein/LPXTG-motif cell wall-anchored protein